MSTNGDEEAAPEPPLSEELGEDNPSGLAGVPSVIAEGVVAALTGIPPQIQRSFYKAVDHVFRAGAHWPASFLKGRATITAARAKVEVIRLEAEAANIKAQQRARDMITRDSAKAAAAQFSNPDKAERAFNFHAANVLRDQDINEDIIRIAAEEMQKEPPKQDSTIEIDSDWLNAFFREAPIRSTDEYRLLFGRILAGEVKEPGTFSIGTIRALASITTDTANVFQSFCNISTSGVLMPRIIADPFGQAGDNSLRDFGLDYTNLMKLVESGLVRSNFDEWQEITPPVYTYNLPIEHAETKLVLMRDGSEASQSLNTNIRVTGPALTSIGKELRRVVTMKHSDKYVQSLANWFKTRNLDLFLSTHEVDGQLFGRKIDPTKPSN